MAITLIHNIHTLYGADPQRRGFLKGREMSADFSMHRAWVTMEKDLITGFGSMDSVPVRADKVIDASGCLVMPAWCDSHTHIVFASSREGEYADRLRGASYEQIAANGGGILNSAAKLRVTPEQVLYDEALVRLHEIMRSGTGAVEIKSGYGLSMDSELKMLRVIRRLKETHTAIIKATFLGAHAIPLEYRDNRKAYIDLILRDMLPVIAAEELADYMDVFCDTGFFTVEETDRLLEAAAKVGLPAKIHANELANSGGVQVGIARGAISVDHLERIGRDEIEALLASDTIPTVLPSCSFFLNIPFAPARTMIDAGLGIAMATDYNPGTSPSGNIPLLMSIACNQMRILPTEAFHAVTINGACAMQAENQAGTIAVGKKANLIMTRAIPSLDYMVYAFGKNHIDKVWINGQPV